jgi:recombination protein RecA
MFGKGISRSGDILDLAVNYNIINKAGAWYSYNGDKIGQGRENTKIYMEERPEFMADVEQQVRAKLGVGAEEEEGSKPAAKKKSKEDTEKDA